MHSSERGRLSRRIGWKKGKQGCREALMVMGLDLDMLSLIISFMDYCCRTVVFLPPVFPSSHLTHQCQNHHARAPTPHIYRSIAVGSALSQHLHQAVTILFYLQAEVTGGVQQPRGSWPHALLTDIIWQIKYHSVILPELLSTEFTCSISFWVFFPFWFATQGKYPGSTDIVLPLPPYTSFSQLSYLELYSTKVKTFWDQFQLCNLLHGWPWAR